MQPSTRASVPVILGDRRPDPFRYIASLHTGASFFSPARAPEISHSNGIAIQVRNLSEVKQVQHWWKTTEAHHLSYSSLTIMPSETRPTPTSSSEKRDEIPFVQPKEERYNKTGQNLVDDESPQEHILHARSPVRYVIRYQDSGGYDLKVQDSHEPLDLEASRARIKNAPDMPVLEVVSVVMANTDPDRYSSRVEEDILENSRYTWTHLRNEIVIRSRRIMKALRGLASYYPGVSFASASLTLQEPYSFLFHVHDDLLNYQKTFEPKNDLENDRRAIEYSKDAAPICDRETSDHITVVHKFMTQQHHPMIEDEKVRWSRSPAVATFEMLWLLFRPGMTVYTKIDGDLCGSVIHAVDADSARIRQSRPYMVVLWHMEYNGRHLSRKAISVTIPYFSGEKSIVSLNVIPSDIYDQTDAGELRHRLESRGEKYYSLLSTRQMEYCGDSLETPPQWVS